MARRLEFQIEERCNGKKIRDFLKTEAKVSHRMLCILKREPMGITVNGVHARTIDLLHTGDRLVLELPGDEVSVTPIPTDIPIEILYMDADLIVVNKQAGLAMHETHNHQGDALSNALAYYLMQIGEPAVFRAVGRLDKGTSGAVVCARNKYCAARLSGQIEKVYLSVVGGVFSGSGTISAPIIRPDPNKTLRAVGAGGEHAVTHWEALHTDGKTTLMRIRLETGRTHQIRVHFAHLGAPLVGDDMYGSTDTRLSHQALHCAECRFTHPVTGKDMHLCAPLPADMRGLIRFGNPTDIIEVTKDKKKYLPLLLLGDEQESMIDRYLDRGNMLLLKPEHTPVGVCVYTNEGNGVFEIKNIAVAPAFQRLGVGKALLRNAEKRCRQNGGRILLVGTGESPLTVPFYKNCGFVFSHRVPDFFTEHYDHPIFEDGVQLRDMVYLKKDL